MAEWIITDGAASPLYGQIEPGMLRRVVRVATEELDPTPFELPLAA